MSTLWRENPSGRLQAENLFDKSIGQFSESIALTEFFMDGGNMATWNTQVIFDPDSSEVGTVIATWTESAGTFVYSSRAKNDGVGVNAFIAAAIAARDIWQTKFAGNIAASAALKAMIIAADPKAV